MQTLKIATMIIVVVVNSVILEFLWIWEYVQPKGNEEEKKQTDLVMPIHFALIYIASVIVLYCEAAQSDVRTKIKHTFANRQMLKILLSTNAQKRLSSCMGVGLFASPL